MFKHATRTPAIAASIEAADEAEITNIELQVSTSDLLNWEATAAMAGERKVNYVVKFPTTLNVTDEVVENCVKLCAALNCQTLVMHAPMFEKFGAQIAELAPSLKLAVENNRFDKAGFENWAESHAALTLDVEHFWKFTLNDAPLSRLVEELSSFLGRYAAKVQQVHLPGYQPQLPVHRPMYCNRDMVFAVLSLLSEHGFEGFVVSEVSSEYINRRELVMDSLLIASWQEQTAPVVAV